MPRTATITFDDVAKTAEALQARGVSVTARTVRAELGSGSSQTVTALLRQWRGHQDMGQISPAEVLDPAIARAVGTYVAQTVSAAVEAHAGRIAALDADLADSLKEQEALSEALVERAQALETLQAERCTQTGRITQMAQEITELRAALTRAQSEASGAQVALAKAEVQVEALAAYRTEVESLRAELAALRQQTAGLHESAAVAQARLEAEIGRREAAEARGAKRARNTPHKPAQTS